MAAAGSGRPGARSRGGSDVLVGISLAGLPGPPPAENEEDPAVEATRVG